MIILKFSEEVLRVNVACIRHVVHGVAPHVAAEPLVEAGAGLQQREAEGDHHQPRGHVSTGQH